MYSYKSCSRYSGGEICELICEWPRETKTPEQNVDVINIIKAELIWKIPESSSQIDLNFSKIGFKNAFASWTLRDGRSVFVCIHASGPEHG